MSARTVKSRLVTGIALGAMFVVAPASLGVAGAAASAEASPTPPGAPAPLYSGPSIAVVSNVELCGVHEFDSLTISSTVRVTHTANAANLFGTGAACSAGAVGTLELRANTLAVTATGAVRGDAVTTDVPQFDADADYPECAAALDQPQSPPDVKCPPAHYRATGNSGGTHAGVGFVGSYPDSGIKHYETDTPDPKVFPGSPGSFQSGYDTPDVDADGDPHNGVHSPVPGVAGAGNGGAAVVLKADEWLEIGGAVTADGANGAGDDSGTADNDPDDNGLAGWQTFQCDHDGDPGTPPFPENTPRQDGPPGGPRGLCGTPDPGGPFEHTGFAGSGGGSGGAIVLQARYTLNLTAAATLSAKGGDGGSGRLGNGGGGGGGVIKVLAPVQRGVASSWLDATTRAGSNGNASLFPFVNAPTEPSYDDPATPQIEFIPQETDGFVVIDARPAAHLLPHGPFWWPGGAGAASATFDGFYVGGGGPDSPADSTTVVLCAVVLPTSAGPADAQALTPIADAMLPTETAGSLPTVADPCGDPGGSGGTITEISRDHRFSGPVLSPAAISIDADTSAYHGLYTTAVRVQTAGNDCFDAGDNAGLGVPSDAADCLLEPLSGIEWMIGVDATRPTVEITSPTEGTLVNDPNVTLAIAAADQPDLSGLDRIECRDDGPGDALTGWVPCEDGSVITLERGPGTHVIQARAFDVAGVVSLIDSVQVTLNEPPVITAVAGGSCEDVPASTGTIALVIDDAESDAADVVVSVSTSDPDVVPPSGIALSGDGSTRDLSVTPSGTEGTSVLTLTASDPDGVTSTLDVTVTVGTGESDTLNGTSRPDILFGGHGADTLTGAAGADLLCGGNGNDLLVGDDGDDTLDGGNGQDQLSGADGDDVLRGGQGSDTLTGGEGSDQFSGGPGADTATDFDPATGDTQDGSIP